MPFLRRNEFRIENRNHRLAFTHQIACADKYPPYLAADIGVDVEYRFRVWRDLAIGV